MFNLLDLEPLLPEEPSPEYEAQHAILNTYYKKISHSFTSDFMDSFLEEEIKFTELVGRTYFLWGLRLGAQLMYQLLSPPPLPKSPLP